MDTEHPSDPSRPRPATERLARFLQSPEQLQELETLLDEIVTDRLAERARVSERDYQALLHERFRAISERETFTPGMLVRWKRFMRNRTKPLDGQTAIVVEVLDEPVFPDKDAGSQYFREPLDIVLGFLDEDGEFAQYHFDSRRFERAREVT
jgi:hypothetical protein